ncbi:DoxX family protein [Streptomyces sp. WG5]|uniref:DoxX family protein n=1 Tax=Streptomyces sp. WG5 TaxID=3417648 RepID=UPI003CF1BA33
MEPLIALLVGFGLARLVGVAGVDVLDAWLPSLRVGLAVMFLFTGFAHFHHRLRAEVVDMVPPVLPRPDLLVTLTGVLQIVGAVGLLIPATALWAAACLILLLIVQYPANVSAARRGTRQGDPIVMRTVHQLVYIGALALTLI